MPETVEIQMPQMGESVTEGTVLEWHKHEGEFVSEGETVVEVSTDKIDAEVPAPASGTSPGSSRRPMRRSRSAACSPSSIPTPSRRRRASGADAATDGAEREPGRG